MEYGIEIWDLELERLQLQMGCLILGVSSKTASDAVRGELGLWIMAEKRPCFTTLVGEIGEDGSKPLVLKGLSLSESSY